MTKKKKLIVIITAVVIAVCAIGATTFAYAQDVAEKNSIGIDEALNVAMLDAGVTEENTIVTKAKMDFEKGVFVYEIEFNSGSYEYDYTIKAADGTIVDKDCDVENNAVTTTTTPTTATTTVAVADEETTQQIVKATQTTQASTAAKNTTAKKTTTTTKSNNSNITLNEAKSIALKNAGFSNSDVTFISAEKDYDDGIAYYDIEFKTSDYKYEYEIDMSGNIVSYDKDKINTQKTTSTTTKASSSKYIGVDKAKSIALENAGLSESNVTFTKAKLEKDDGVYEYEIEFIYGNKEYEYEINATSGKIISHSVENVDYDD